MKIFSLKYGGLRSHPAPLPSKMSSQKNDPLAGMANHARNDQDRGFILGGMLVLLPLILLMLLCGTLLGGFLTLDQGLKKICREELWKIQDQEQQKIQNLLRLNPLALQLKVEHDLLLLKIAQATAAGRLEVAAYFAGKLQRNLSQRKRLERMQKFFLESSRLSKNRQIISLRQRLQKFAAPMARSSYFTTQLLIQPSLFGPMSVRPAFQDLAPPYELAESFSEKQALRLFWKVEFRNGPFLSQRLPFHWKWERECGVTLEKNERVNSWQKIILTDRSFWK